MRLSRKQKRNIAIATLLFLVPAIGVGVWLLLQDQDTRTGASGAQGKIIFSPSTVTKAVNEQFTINVISNPDSANGGNTHAVDVILQFDPAKLEALSVTKGTNPGTYPYQGKETQIDNTTGKVRISWVAYDSGSKEILSPMSTPTPIGQVTFKVKAEGGNNIDLVYTGVNATLDSNIAQKLNSQVLDILSEKSAVAINGGGGSGDDGGGDDGGDDGGGDDGGDDGGTEPITGDINGDGKVSLADYSIFVQDYNLCKTSDTCNSRSDLDNNGTIGIDDYLIFLNAYLESK